MIYYIMPIEYFVWIEVTCILRVQMYALAVFVWQQSMMLYIYIYINILIMHIAILLLLLSKKPHGSSIIYKNISSDNIIRPVNVAVVK